MTKEEFLKKVSKIDQTGEDEFKAEYNSPTLLWDGIHKEEEKTDKPFCNKGWHNGSCCCNCIHQKELYKHPGNTEERVKGSIMDETGLYACTFWEDIEDRRHAIVFDTKHGICEGHKSI